MQTTLPLGTWVRTKWRGEWEFSQIVMCDGALCRRVDTPVAGTYVQPCVWKGEDVLEPRGKPVLYP